MGGDPRKHSEKVRKDRRKGINTIKGVLMGWLPLWPAEAIPTGDHAGYSPWEVRVLISPFPSHLGMRVLEGELPNPSTWPRGKHISQRDPLLSQADRPREQAARGTGPWQHLPRPFLDLLVVLQLWAFSV